MREQDVKEDLLVKGEYCQKGVPGCFCEVGWPYERLCPNCRDREEGKSNYRTSYCVCPPKEIQIRNAIIEDCGTVQKLCETVELLTPFGKPPRLEWFESFVNEKQIFLVAEENKEIVGFLMAERICGDTAYIQMARALYEGKGIAEELYEQAEKEFIKRGLKAIIFYGYGMPRKAFKKLGFCSGKTYTEYLKFL